MTMADRVVCMNQGRVEQIGSPEELYTRPATPFVATFLGRMNVLEFPGEPTLAGRPLQIPQSTRGADEAVHAYVRPEHIELGDTTPAGDTVNQFPAAIGDLQFEGNITRYRVQVDDRTLEVETLGYPTRKRGDRVTLRIPPEAIRAFD